MPRTSRTPKSKKKQIYWISIELSLNTFAQLKNIANQKGLGLTYLLGDLLEKAVLEEQIHIAEKLSTD